MSAQNRESTEYLNVVMYIRNAECRGYNGCRPRIKTKVRAGCTPHIMQRAANDPFRIRQPETKDCLSFMMINIMIMIISSQVKSSRCRSLIYSGVHSHAAVSVQVVYPYVSGFGSRQHPGFTFFPRTECVAMCDVIRRSRRLGPVRKRMRFVGGSTSVSCT